MAGWGVEATRNNSHNLFGVEEGKALKQMMLKDQMDCTVGVVEGVAGRHRKEGNKGTLD